MSTIRMESASPLIRRATMGVVREDIWITLAADLDGVIQHEEIGKRVARRRIMFAFKHESEEWLAKEEIKGWERVHGPTPCAAAYFGETDSPSNCWSAETEKAMDTS